VKQALSTRVMLAASMQAQPGLYAILLGSGVSTGAGVPTGWGVVKELLRRVAAAVDPADEQAASHAAADPEGWWAQHAEGDLGYATLLEHLAPTAAARQGLLADFFEPSDEDREEGLKVPTRAHRAIAHLVKRGSVRVLLTTNFDRLMEQALEAAGVSPQVVSRPEAITRMAPLAHARATVVKLHGDYKDLGSRNTPSELSQYPPEWTTLLNQIFDEYGLIIAGWSADWDTALAAALEASSNRRYPLYWDSRSSKGSAAKRLLTNRGGHVLQAADADELFTELLASVEALERLAEPPLTTAMAVARLKRYLADPVRRIDLHDLVMRSADTVADTIAEQPLTVSRLDGATIQAIYEGHLEGAAPLVHLIVGGTWHDPEGTHDQLWVDALQRLVDAGTAPLSSVTQGLDDTRLLPALFALSAVGIAAARRGRDGLFIRMSTEVQGRRRMGTSDPVPAAQLLHANRILEHDWVNAMPRWGDGGGRWLYPASHLLKADMRRFFGQYIPLETDYVEAFHGYEYRLGLIQEKEQDGVPGAYRAMSGEYVGEQGWSWDSSDVVPLAELAFRKHGERSRNWPWNQYLGGAEQVHQVLVAHREILKRYRGL
jgi:hypothetical protein